MEEKEFDNFDDVKAEETETEEVVEEIEEKEEEPREGENKEEESEEEPDKFKGKSREEIIKSYRELENLNAKKENPVKREDRITSKEQKERLDKLREEIEKMDFTKMDPKTYTNWIFEKNRQVMEAETLLREKVRREVLQVYREFPQLQLDKNEELRGLVLAIVNDYKSRGESIGIREAVAKVNKMIEGFKGKGEVKEEEKKEVKKPKAIEKTEPVTMGKGEDTEEDKVKKGILNAGSRAGMLGGL